MTGRPQRVVAVTGGSRGIGRAVCLALAAPETHVYFNYARSGSLAGETEKALAAAGASAVGMQVDVSRADEVKHFFDTIIERSGRLDVLVNNAGITRDGLLVRMKDRDWNDVIDVNLKGAFHCTRAAAKTMMKQRSGRIVNVTSVVGATGNPGQANYVASKAGIIGLTKAVAKELAPRGITVNAVAPGYVETDMTAGLTDQLKETMIRQIPLSRAGTPEDVAAVVAFLASDGAAYITGQVMHVSGGMFM